MSFLEEMWNRKIWAHKLETRAKLGHIRTPQQMMDMDGAAHLVQLIELAKNGR
jgi:hypothetical protein